MYVCVRERASISWSGDADSIYTPRKPPMSRRAVRQREGKRERERQGDRERVCQREKERD